MLDPVAHAEPLRRGLLAGHDDIDAIPASQAMVGYIEQAIGVRRQVDANGVGLFVAYMIDETRILMTEPIVILPPHVGGQEIIERRNRAAPRNLADRLQPF